jgi:adenine phosphoribosyltransferase
MNTNTIENALKEKIRDLPDWPQKGVLFRDITTVLKDPEAFKAAIDALAGQVKDLSFDAIVAVESRGFIFGATLAYKLGKGFIPVRKKGKLPCKTISQTYDLEYGTDTIQMHEDAISQGQKVLVVDDLIATGGSARATAALVEQLGGSVEAFAFLIELTFLDGRKKLEGHRIISLVKY